MVVKKQNFNRYNSDFGGFIVRLYWMILHAAYVGEFPDGAKASRIYTSIKW